MSDWLQFIGMIFYAPLRGIREVRDRGGLLPAFLCAYLSQLLYMFAVQWLSGDRAFLTRPSVIFANLFHAATALLPFAIVLVPLIALIANLFDRRGSFGVVLQQEYASLASVIFYVLIAANLMTILIATFFHFSGVQAAYVASSMQKAEQIKSLFTVPEVRAQLDLQLRNPALIAVGLFSTVKIGLFTIGALETVRKVFRLSIPRSLAVLALTYAAAFALSPIWTWLFTTVVGSPFLLLMLFFLFRGYFSSVVSTQRARGAFKQNLEAATINPRDSSAHYNLALIHQTRGELDQARERFQRAIDIDPDETDSHYQLGRIARSQNRLAEAIGHFEQVVQRDQYHALNEIWREIGATYIAAGQFADAREALQKFLERRENDPQGLYLMGRAHAGLGDQKEAANSMQACIDAVKTAPAYKYRAEKRWLHEAQQFLKGKKREAVSSER
ncbi:MAG TPA: tetratricopeptide repeat protein [Pyrinomonadaceae bacterium]